ncbi:MAG: DUF971 domain-containing protein [Alphaproteobacteria bacterium]|nr:DUF971 domain-containing protein [Alphaproteobacteria bacterium]
MPSDNPTPNPWPSEIRLNPAQDVLTVAFDDGSRFDLAAEYLRVESPSAEVRNHGGPKTIVLGKKHVTIANVEPVGNYAVRLSFSDGHDTGLYSWAYLHQLGAEKDRIWGDYLAAAAKKGA